MLLESDAPAKLAIIKATVWRAANDKRIAIATEVRLYSRDVSRLVYISPFTSGAHTISSKPITIGDKNPALLMPGQRRLQHSASSPSREGFLTGQFPCLAAWERIIGKPNEPYAAIPRHWRLT